MLLSIKQKHTEKTEGTVDRCAGCRPRSNNNKKPPRKPHSTCRRKAESSVYWLRSTLSRIYSPPHHSLAARTIPTSQFTCSLAHSPRSLVSPTGAAAETRRAFGRSLSDPAEIYLLDRTLGQVLSRSCSFIARAPTSALCSLLFFLCFSCSRGADREEDEPRFSTPPTPTAAIVDKCNFPIREQAPVTSSPS